MAAPRRNPPGTEPGAAALTVALAHGELTVTHADGSVLLQGPLPLGGWHSIIDALLAAAPAATGPMRLT